MPQITINNFSEGIQEDTRIQTDRGFSFARNFNTQQFPNRLVPRATMEDVTSASGGSDVEENDFSQFVVGADGLIWAKGQVSAADDDVKLFKSEDSVNTAGASFLWETNASYESTAHKKSNGNVFINYQDYIVGIDVLDGRLWRFGTMSGGSPSITDNYQNFATGTTSSNGVVGSDDALYFGVDNILYILDGISTGAPNGITTAMTIPDIYSIVQIENYRDRIVVGAKPLKRFESSKLFTYNVGNLAADPEEVVNLGRGDLVSLSVLDDVVVAVMSQGGAEERTKKVAIKTWGGGRVETLKTLDFGTVTEITPVRINSNLNEKAYFVMLGSGDTEKTGLYSVGRPNNKYPYSITMDSVLAGDSTTVSTVNGVMVLGDYVLSATTDTNTGLNAVHKSAPAITTSGTTAIYETQKYHGGRFSRPKKLNKVTLGFQPLDADPTGDTVTLKYRTDEETSWTTIIDAEGTDEQMFRSAYKDANGEFNEFHEIQFRIESVNGATITELSFDYDFINEEN